MSPTSAKTPAPPARRPLRIVVTTAAITSLCAAGLVAASQPAQASTPSHLVSRTSTFAPNADSYTSTTNRHRNYGHSRNLDIGRTYGNTRRTYLRFSVPTGGTVTSAKLTLTRAIRWRANTLAAATTRTTWSESGITAGNAPPTTSRIFTYARVRRSSRTVTLDITPAIRAHRTVSIVVTARGTRLIRFASRQAADGRPVLRVTIQRRVYDPAPAPAPGPAPGPAPAPGCTVSTILVPSCGRWWGVAPMAFRPMALDTSVGQEESIAARPMQIVHTYHVNDQLFPTAAERAIAMQPGHNRMLLINWKPATDMSWAAVAAGRADARIDRLAAYIKSSFTQRFYLAIFHEPENDVNPTAGSGWTAADYSAMFRHTVLRLRAAGATNAITVMNYMGFSKWMRQSWFPQMWPGNDVVDWIGLDPYGSGSTGGYNARDFATLVDRPELGYPGYYTWAKTTHPGKPIMLCEWGIQYDPANPTGQATFFDSMQSQLAAYPNIKALVYYDVPTPPPGLTVRTTVTLNSSATNAFRRIAASTVVRSPQWSY